MATRGKGKNRVALMTSADLRKLDSRIAETLNELYVQTNAVLQTIMGDIRESIGCLYKLSDTIAMLDLLRSFATVVTLAGPGAYRRPEFGDALAVQVSALQLHRSRGGTKHGWR